MVVLFTVILALSSGASAAGWTEQVLHSFQGRPDGAEPAGGVIFGKDGNLYGTTYGGGQGIGTVFQLLKNGHTWTETVLYSFQGKDQNDGDIANGGLVSDPEGNLYGVAAYGGSGNCVLLGADVGCGIVYEMTRPATPGGTWTESVIYSFQGGKDGYVPWGDLTFDAKGNLYGATEFGGGKGNTCDPFYQYCGTVFELSPPKQKGGHWIEKVLHSFKSGTDGANPNGGLVLDTRGAVYGTTFIGGYNCPHNSGQGCGTVFRLTPPTSRSGAWTETVLHRFKGPPDGGGPSAGVIFDRDGILYGTTAAGGGSNFGQGTVFELVPHSNGTWRELVLYSFKDGDDGNEPSAALVLDTGGNLVGVATGGGIAGGGTIFRLRPTGRSWAFTALYEFTGNPDGAYPAGGVIFDAVGNLYSTTQRGGNVSACGSYGCGTVFQVKP